MKPQRIQLSRRKGFNLHALSKATNGLPAVNIARPGKWGNPFRVPQEHDRYRQRLEAVRRFARWMDGEILCAVSPSENYPDPKELRGKNLACWCPLDQPCHGDVLLELAARHAPAARRGGK